MSAKPSIQSGQLVEIKRETLKPYGDVEFLCKCKPKMVCRFDQHDELLVIVNPPRIEDKSEICPKPEKTKEERYELELKDYNIKLTTSQDSNQMSKKLKSCTKPPKCPDFEQPGTPPNQPRVPVTSTNLDVVTTPPPEDDGGPTPPGGEEGVAPEFCEDCLDVVKELEQLYLETYVNPFLEDVDKLTVGKTITDIEMARVINASSEFIVNHVRYKTCVITKCGGRILPPDKQNRQYPTDSFCEQAFVLVRPVFETMFRKAGLTYSGKPTENSSDLYVETYTKVLNSNVYKSIRYSKAFEALNECDSRYETIPEECVEYAVFNSDTGLWTAISSNLVPCMKRQFSPPSVDISERDDEDCGDFVSEDGTVSAGFILCKETKKGNSAPSPTTCEPCSQYLMGAVLLRKESEYLSPGANLDLYTRVKNTPAEVKLAGDFEIFDKLLSLDDKTYLWTFGYDSPVGDMPAWTDLSVTQLNLLFGIGARQHQIVAIRWIKTPATITYTDFGGREYTRSLYDYCMTEICNQDDPKNTYCPECKDYVEWTGMKLPGYRACVKEHCADDPPSLIITDRICDNILDSEECKQIAEQYGIASDEWIECFLENSFVYCSICDDTKRVFGSDSEQYKRCVEANCASGSICADCTEAYETYGPASREYLYCLVKECLIGQLGLCFQCCDLSDPVEQQECIEKFCLEAEIKENECLEDNLKDTVVPIYEDPVGASTVSSKKPTICEVFLSPSQIHALRENNIHALVAGKRVLINGVPYIEDRLDYDGTVIIRRTRMVTDEDIVGYIGEDIASTLPADELEAQIESLREQLTRIEFSTVGYDGEELVVDTGIITACAYKQNCANQFFEVETDLEEGKQVTTVTNKLTQEETVFEILSEPTFLEIPGIARVEEEISPEAISQLIENDPKIRNLPLQEPELTTKVKDIISKSPHLFEVMKYISDNNIKNTTFVIEHITQQKTAIDFIKPDGRQVLSNPRSPREVTPRSQVKVQRKSEATPVEISQQEFPKQYVTVQSSNGFDVVIPSKVVSTTVTKPTLEKIKAHLELIEREHEIRTADFLVLTVRVVIPKAVTEYAIESEPYSGVVARLDQIVAETFIEDASVRKILQDVDLKPFVEVYICDDSYRGVIANPRLTDRSRPIIEVVLQVDEGRVEEFQKMTRKVSLEAQIDSNNFIDSLRNLAKTRIYERPIDAFVFNRRDSEQETAVIEIRD